MKKTTTLNNRSTLMFILYMIILVLILVSVQVMLTIFYKKPVEGYFSQIIYGDSDLLMYSWRFGSKGYSDTRHAKELNITVQEVANIKQQITALNARRIAEAEAYRIEKERLDREEHLQQVNAKRVADTAAAAAVERANYIERNSITNQQNGILVYNACGFRGTSAFLPAGKYNSDSLASLSMDRSILSIEVGNKCTVSTDTPHKMEFIENQSCLTTFRDKNNPNTQWGCNISSLEVQCSEGADKLKRFIGPRRGAFLYSNCASDMPSFLPPGIYNEQTLLINNINNDTHKVVTTDGCLLRVKIFDGKNINEAMYRGDMPCQASNINLIEAKVICS